MNKREIKLDKYGISSKRYKELCGFCEQYPEWKDFLYAHDGSAGAMQYSDMPKAHNTSSSVEELVIKREKYVRKCAIIEKSAHMADKSLAEFLIKGVCYGYSVSYLTTVCGMYISERSYYRIRRKFFYYLDQEVG